MTDNEIAMAGFVHGENDPMLKAVLVEIRAAREARVLEAAYAPNDREANQALGAVKALDDLKEKLEFQVAEAARKLHEQG